MRIAIFGLGYVGSVSSACLAAAGHQIIGVDPDERKLAMFRSGKSPITEPGLDELVTRAVTEGRLTVTADAAAAVHGSDLCLVCVGTPSRRNGSLDTTYLERVIDEIGAALAAPSAPAYYVVAVRSTMLPGVLGSQLIPRLEKVSGRRVGPSLGVAVNPEFLREGSAIKDFDRPPFTLIGTTDATAGDTLEAVYTHLGAPVHRILPDEASMVKYASNIYHALKIAFGNEIGAVCQQLGIDGQRVMRIFCEDRDLNISHRYLTPGFGFGGSCLPKDLRAMVYVAKELDLVAPVIASVIPSNDGHIQRVVDTVLAMGKPRVALLGLSFKVGSDDLRESPFVRLAEALIGKGIPLRVFDSDVALHDVFGRNRDYVDAHLPHVGQLVSADFAGTVEHAQVVIVGKRLPAVDGLLARLRPDQQVIDLVGIEQLSGALRPWAAAARDEQTVDWGRPAR